MDGWTYLLSETETERSSSRRKREKKKKTKESRGKKEEPRLGETCLLAYLLSLYNVERASKQAS